jgi:hypothetical protein
VSTPYETPRRGDDGHLRPLEPPYDNSGDGGREEPGTADTGLAPVHYVRDSDSCAAADGQV